MGGIIKSSPHGRFIIGFPTFTYMNYSYISHKPFKKILKSTHVGDIPALWMARKLAITQPHGQLCIPNIPKLDYHLWQFDSYGNGTFSPMISV